MSQQQEQAHAQSTLARIFAICDSNRVAMLKAREDQKLSRRFWWQDEKENETQTKLKT